MRLSWRVIISCQELCSGSRLGPHSQSSSRRSYGDRMIVGIGIDLIECNRVERELRQRPLTTGESVFTAEELRRCGEGAGRAAQLAACFAAKEAALKALGAEIEDIGLFREVELLFRPGGKRQIVLHARARAKAESLGVRHIWVSIASAKKHIGVSVVMES
jgi:holo-[acyl-carrier protein] synthase